MSSSLSTFELTTFGVEQLVTIKLLKDLLLNIANLPMEKQREELLSFHDKYRGTEEQVDDICVIGVRV